MLLHVSVCDPHHHHICHGVGPLVDPCRSHVSRSLFKGPPYFLLPVEEQCFITLGNLLRGFLFTCCIHFLLYSSNLSKIGVIFNSFVICVFVLYFLSGFCTLIFTYKSLEGRRIDPVLASLAINCDVTYDILKIL